MKLDITNAECIKTQKNLTNTTYYNICDGTQSVVRIGTADIVGGVLSLVFFSFMCWVLFKISRDL